MNDTILANHLGDDTIIKLCGTGKRGRGSLSLYCRWSEDIFFLVYLVAYLKQMLELFIFLFSFEEVRRVLCVLHGVRSFGNTLL